MGCPSEVEIGDDLVFSVTTHDPDTGVLTDADGAPTYRIYEDETATPILTGTMAKLDDANTTGFYTELIDIEATGTAGNFEDGKTYTIYIEATVDGDKGGICFGFKAYDSLGVKPATPGRKLAVAADNKVAAYMDADDAGWVDASGRIDVGKWLGEAVTTSATSKKPHVDAFSVSDDETAANTLELQYDGTGITGDTYPATQAALGKLSSGSAAINTVPESFTKSGAEPETASWTATGAPDGVSHIVEDIVATGITDCYYQFDIGSDGVPVTFTWLGYAQGNTDTYTIYAYNYALTAYEQIGTVDAVNGTTPVTETFNLTTGHVGVTGADIGKVRFRFYSSDGSLFATDRLLCSYSVVRRTVGYALGAVWVDTVNGTAGTVSYTNGTADNPVDNIADALTIAAAIGLIHFEIATGSTITLAATMDGKTLNGKNWTLALGSESCSDSVFVGATVSGICTGANKPRFERCIIDAVTLPPSIMLTCAFSNTITAGSAGEFFFVDCLSLVAGTSTPTFDFGAGLNASEVSFRRYVGGIEIQNMGAGTGSYNMSLEGDGQLIINANCSATSTIAIRGNFTVTDNASGAVTLSDDARIDVDQINAACDAALTDTPVTLSDAGQQDLAQARYKTAGVVWYVDVAGNDSNTGLSPDTAKLTLKTVIEAASANDVVLLGPGRFDLGQNFINGPDYVSFYGAGMDATWITSTARATVEGCIIKPGSYATVADMTIEGSLSGTGQGAIGSISGGAAQDPFTRAVGLRLRLIADYDGAYLYNDAACSLTLIDCIVEVNFDGLVVGKAGNELTTFDTTVIAKGPSGAGTGTTRAVVATGGTVRCFNSDIRALDGGIGTTIGYYANTAGTIEAYGGSIYTSGAAGDIYDANNNGTLLMLSGVSYDRSKTTGTITHVDSTVDVATKTGFALASGGLDSVTAWTVDITGSLSGSVGSVTADVTTDAASRTASKATGYSTHDAAAVKTAIEADGSKIDHIWETTEDNAGTRRFTEAGLVNAPTGGASAADVADAVWEEAVADHSDTAGSTAKALNDLSVTTGSGAWAITITVDDGTTELESAKVRFTKGGESYQGTTNASGVATFSLDTGTWAVAITLPTYSFTPTTLVISDDASQTYSMTAESIPASDPTFVTGYIYCYDEDGTVEADVEVDLKFAEITSDTGFGYDMKIRTAISNAAGLVSFTNLTKGASYYIRRGDKMAWKKISVASDAESPVALTSVWGEED